MSKNTKPTTCKQNADCAKCKETENRITLCVRETERENQMRKRNNTKLQHTTREAAAAKQPRRKAKKNQNAKSKIQPNTKKIKLVPKTEQTQFVSTTSH
jgi:hypothetical protein